MKIRMFEDSWGRMWILKKKGDGYCVWNDEVGEGVWRDGEGLREIIPPPQSKV